MKYVINRNKYNNNHNQPINEKIVWLENKQKEWNQNFSKLIMSFHNIINEMIKELRESFNDKNDPDEVNGVYLEYFEKAFESLIEEIRNVEDDDVLHKLWNELVLNFYLWKDSFSKMSEKLDNYNSIFKLGFELFSRITVYTTKNISKDYYKGLKEGEIDDKRQNVISFIENFYEEVKSRLTDVSPEDVFSMSNLDEKETDELALDAGDEVRYNKNDDEENIAIISHNQEDLKETDNIRLVSKSDGEQFEIDKSELIEIIPKHKTTNQEVSDKLKKIKSDPDKLDKLNGYLDKLSLTENVDTDLDPYYIDWKSTKEWMSNLQFKRIHIKLIGTMLRDVYKPIGHWGKHEFWGIVNLEWETTKWSILNKINTNWYVLPIIINELNRALVEGGSPIEPFNLVNIPFGSQKFYNEYYRMMAFIDKNKTKIFLKLDENTGSKIINKIVAQITSNTLSGDNAEKLVCEYLPQIFSNATEIKMPEGYGEAQDMVGGIDVTFNEGNIPKTIQVKKCRAIFKGKDGKYRVMGTSLAKHYNVDYIACVSNYDLAFFNYNSTKIEILTNGDIKLDSDLLIKNIKLK
tara:strand:+ start:9160 stop:10887 length:1728 start_codon:yes stop_codon:yes gene_type:complete